MHHRYPVNILLSIVEAYTFNFRVSAGNFPTLKSIDGRPKYHKAHGSDSVVPILTFGDDLQRSNKVAQDDPITEAAKKGLNPTLRDVKKSVKVSGLLIPPEVQADCYRPCSRPSYMP